MLPIQFLLFAEDTLKFRPHPAGFRSAVSRAYYAAFHHIKEFIESAGVTISSGPESHADVRNHLAVLGDPDVEQIGNEIAGLRGTRNDANYKLGDGRLEKLPIAQLEVNRARDLIERIDKCKNDATRYDHVKAAIKRLHRKLRGQ